MCSCGVFDGCFDVTEANGSSYSAFSKYLPEESWQHGWTSSNKASHQRILLDLLTPQQTAALLNIQDEEEHGIEAQELHDIMVCDRLSSTQSSCFLMSLIYLHICTGGHLLQIHPFCGTELVRLLASCRGDEISTVSNPRLSNGRQPFKHKNLNGSAHQHHRVWDFKWKTNRCTIEKGLDYRWSPRPCPFTTSHTPLTFSQESASHWQRCFV